MNFENVRIKSAFRGISSPRREYKNRESHALVYKQNGASLYRFGDTELLFSEGDVIFIPQGSSYTVERITEVESGYLLINFDTESDASAPTVFKRETSAGLGKLFEQITKTVSQSDAAHRYESLSIFFSILSALLKRTAEKYINSEKLALLKRGTTYIEEHIYDPELRIEDAAERAGISAVYFRRLFTEIYGKSPKRHVIEKRLTQAKAMIESGDFDHIYEISECVGFSDALYFSKCYKKKYGHSPTEKV